MQTSSTQTFNRNFNLGPDKSGSSSTRITISYNPVYIDKPKVSLSCSSSDSRTVCYIESEDNLHCVVFLYNPNWDNGASGSITVTAVGMVWK